MARLDQEDRAFDGDGNSISPRAGVVPILKQLEPNVLSVIGTGFYISRYGLFMTAAHVLSDVVDSSENKITPSYICHPLNDKEVNLRRIVGTFVYLNEDIAIGQADNYSLKFPKSPLRNMRVSLSGKVPEIGCLVTTYAYPENKVLDFRTEEESQEIHSDYYDGKFLKDVRDSEHPHLPYRHYETSILIKSGASGGPVFCNGEVIGINCRGWDFGTDDDTLSYIIPIEAGLDIELTKIQIPEISWEYSQIPPSERGKSMKLSKLIEYGHVVYAT